MNRTTNRSWRPALVLFISSLSLTASAVDSLPTAEDINDLSQKAGTIYESFFSQTFTIRMQYEFSGRFLNQQDKDSLCKAAEESSAQLKQIANGQNILKYKIENYQNDDWEVRFGETGLWRKLAADLLKTKLNKLEIDYYLANFCSEDAQRKQSLENLLSQSYAADILKAKILCALARTDDKYQQPARKHLAELSMRSSWSWCEALKSSMERIKCFGPTEPNELDDLAKAISKSECKDDSEMLLSLAILQCKYAQGELQNILSRSPQTTTLLGKLILADMSARFASPDANFASVNPAEADLAAYTAWTTDPCEHKALLLAMADLDKFKTPLILYVAGVSVADSEPEKTIELLIGASTLQQKQKSILLDIESDRIAEQAAQLAYDRFAQKNIDCTLAVAAFDNYVRIASDKITEQMQYLYGSLLLDCSKIREATEAFTRLAERSKTVWRDKAALKLIKMKINTGSSLTIPDEILAQLRKFILDCAGQNEQKRQLRSEAINIYCPAMLSRDDSDSAEQVLSLLDTAEQTPGLRYDLFRAQSLRQSGRLEESAHFMSKAIIIDSGSMAPSAVQIVSEIVDKIELWQKDANDFNQMLLDCNTLAEFADKSINSRQTALILAELSILQGKRGQAPFLPADENDVNWLRFQARLLMAQDKFEQSAKLWAKIAERQRIDMSSQNQKSWGWWQAKFYELYCLAKTPQPDKPNIRHAIEVLQNTYTDIPSPWPEKLNGLREMCGN
jgi:hypothetical protein